MKLFLPLLIAVLTYGPLAHDASAQHGHGAPGEIGPSSEPPGRGVAEAFAVTGLRVDADSVPPGSAVGRAGLRYADGGYVSVVHGKPYARGRVVFGGLVGMGAVWVAGAHRAAEMVTTVPLRIGETTLARGAYSLFVTPRDGAWTLHVNQRLGMHLADEYDPTKDLALVDATPTALDAPVDGLTWAFADDGSALVLSWATTQVAFPFARADG